MFFYKPNSKLIKNFEEGWVKYYSNKTINQLIKNFTNESHQFCFINLQIRKYIIAPINYITTTNSVDVILTKSAIQLDSAISTLLYGFENFSSILRCAMSQIEVISK